MTHSRIRQLLSTALVVVVSCSYRSATAQTSPVLISRFDSAKQAVAGQWSRSDGELKVASGRARAVLAESVPESYSLNLEFTRTSGDDSIGVILPVGNRQCLLNMSTFGGEAHGIAVIDGKFARDNVTTIRPGKLNNDHVYRLLIEVEVDGSTALIASQLDGRPFLQWAGNPASLTMMAFWKLPRTTSLGLHTDCDATFHAITLAKLDPKMRMTQRPKPTTAEVRKPRIIEFEGKRWAVDKADRVKVEEFAGSSSLHIEGKESCFVFLPDVSFEDGTIEVDIASDTFSGIGFRAVQNGLVAEKLYFRPFNSGTAKHEKTVQYSMMGQKEYGWQALRKEFPGKYESGADLKVNDWFHVRLEIRGKRLRAFVNDATEPVLVVDEMLGAADRGRIGVWGWDSYFKNFTYRPAD